MCAAGMDWIGNRNSPEGEGGEERRERGNFEFHLSSSQSADAAVASLNRTYHGGSISHSMIELKLLATRSWFE